MRVLKRLGVGLLVMVLVLAALWTWSRWRGPTPAQRTALELLEAPNAFAGRNAFDAIWVLAYDVPDAETATVTDADMRALAEAASGAQDGPLAFSSQVARYPLLRPVASAEGLRPCGIREADCLAKVEGATDDYAALVQANARLIERIEGLSRFDHYASRLPTDLRVPFPEFNLLNWPLTAHAVQFAQGDHMQAVEAACRGLATWRGLGTHSDVFTVRMLGITLATDGYGALLADMLARVPRNMPLPSACDVALAEPVAADASVCPAMRGEFAWSMGAADALPGMPELEDGGWLVLDRDGFRAMMAEQLAPPCRLQDSDLAADQRFAGASSPRPAWRRLECVANSVGCIQADIAGPAYDAYAWRAQDYSARLQLLATLAWLRDQPDTGTLTERIARRPVGLRSPVRDITVGADGRSLEIAQYDTSRGATWSLPLPPYLVESTATPD